MKIQRIMLMLLVAVSVVFLSPSVSFAQEYDSSSESGINSGNHGLHLRGALGAGRIFWGYISHSSGSGDLGTGVAGTINLAAMYNYSVLGLEFNMLSGNVDDLKWTDKDDLGIKTTYESTGTGSYNVFDFKIGAKLFTEPGDMGYTYFFAGKRYWNSDRTEETRKEDGIPQVSLKQKREAEGDGWIFGFRDFSTIGMDNGLAIVLQTGIFAGKAPLTKMSTNGVNQPYPEKESFSFGSELGAGVAFQNIGLSVIGGLRGEINASTIDDPTVPAGEDSIFGFGNAIFFVEAGMMF